MPKLKCEAKSCIYNCEQFCAKSIIHVNNDLDSKKCVSYSEQKFENQNFNTEFASMDTSDKYVSIDCEAKSCDYNANGMCVSEKVNIGCGNENCKNKAKCNTFSL